MQSVSTRKILSCLSLTLLLTGCGSQSADPDSAEGQRQAVFKQFLAHSEPMGGMLSGRLAFDGEVFASHASQLAELADAPWEHFPEPDQNNPQPNTALPEVWSDADGFAELITQYQAAVADLSLITAAGIDSPEQVTPAMQAVQQACKACHDGYRR
ncbi:cytochrome c [Halopseudomonas pelagia]|uniref:c-type cytochrome n=1 Tax=Halopseudomonas pelagia TaxID=553151 RepID=UPI0030DA0DE6|tara:strand:+ start:584 stop:1051 length:468 start_codon:yes stop_codon:yes gene_type:complete